MKAASREVPTPKKASVDLAKVRPNELGQVMILEYHEIGPKEARWTRTPKNFRKDLQRLYELGYRPISLRDYVAGNINTEAGKTPVVITFDDSTQGQFRILPDGKVDPDSAFGILQDFHIKHPDFPAEATFFATYPAPFGQPKLTEWKFKEIISAGMDIGNHTYSHDSLKKLTSEEVVKELALAVREGLKLDPKARIDTVALPYGLAPKDQNVLESGSYDGTKYRNIAALLVGANPAPSPADPKFDPFRLPRIQAVDPSIATCGIDQWLNYFKKHPEKRYISDGDPETVTVPEAEASGVKVPEGKRIVMY